MQYFYYERKQRKSAAICVLNIIVAFVMLLLAHKYLPSDSQKEATDSFLYIANIAFVVVAIVLSCIAIYLFKKNKAIKVWVSETQLCIIDPSFGDFELLVDLKDIAEFSQTKSAGTGYFNTGLIMKNGDYKPLVFNNYHLNKSEFFKALSSANPDIRVPESAYSHKLTRPMWAQKLRAKFGLKDKS